MTNYKMYVECFLCKITDDPNVKKSLTCFFYSHIFRMVFKISLRFDTLQETILFGNNHKYLVTRHIVTNCIKLLVVTVTRPAQ